MTGAADDDPSGITTYSQAGAQFQYGLLWTVLLQIPLMAAVQLMAGRIGKVAGKDFAEVLAERFSPWVLWGACVLLVGANTFTAGADIAGIAAAVHLLVGVPEVVVALVIAIALTLALVFASYHLIRDVLKWLTAALFAYVVSGVLAHPHWGEVLHRTFVPGIEWTQAYLAMFVAVFGTTITPYLFVWQSAEEVADQKEDGKRTVVRRHGATGRELHEVEADTIIGMTVSQVIGYFVIVAAGAVLFTHGVHDIDSAAQAARALEPIGGGAGQILFSLGIVGTGLLAIPTLSGSSAYVLAAVMRWPVGIAEEPRRARKFYWALAATTLVAGAIAMSGRSAMKLLVAAAVLNGVLAPPLLVLLLIVANDGRVLGKHTNGWLANSLGVLATAIMGAAALALLAVTARSMLAG